MEGGWKGTIRLCKLITGSLFRKDNVIPEACLFSLPATSGQY